MKKYLIALLAFSPVLCFGDTYDFRVYRYSGTGNLNEESSMTAYYNYNNIDPSSVLSVLMSSSVGVCCNPQRYANEDTNPLYRPTSPTTPALTQNYARPLVIHTSTGDVQYVSLIYHSSDARAFYNFVARLFQSGYTPVMTNNQHFVRSSSANTNNAYRYGNFSFSTFLLDLESTTNNLYRSMLSDYLKSISQSLSNIHTSINNINVDLGQFQNDYSFVNASHFNITNVINNAVNNSDIPSRLGNSLKTEAINPFNYDHIQSILGAYMAAQWLPLAFSDSDLGSPMRSDSRVKSGLANLGDSFGAGAAGHYITPLTNQMQRMTTDWADDTRAALSNNTQKIKDDLAAWKNQLHGTQTSIDNSAANINNTLNNIAGGSSVVRVNVQNQDIGVTITDPVTIDPTQFNTFSEDLGKAGDYMERLFNEFKWWAWDSPDSWKKGFLDRDLSRLSSNVQDQVSIQHSISNLLADFALNYTNNAQFAISNALAGFSFSSTNDYLLLSDYQSFIDSSKFNDVVSSLPEDLAAALSSFGFSDSSEYSGRWWVFQSANMALQSQLALTNAALSSTLLNALSAIDDSDDSGGSLLSRWLSLIDSIPDPEEIQQSLADATNIVSNIGFERADVLYSTATQDLVSVVKGIYLDKSLPDNIRFVFIPAANGRDEKFVDIPVGDHSSLWSLFRSGMAFALSVVTLLLFPKYVSWLVSHYTRLVERIIKSLHAYTHQ